MSNQSHRIVIVLPHDMLAAVDEYRRLGQSLPNRAEAVRQLIRRGLDVAETINELRPRAHNLGMHSPPEPPAQTIFHVRVEPPQPNNPPQKRKEQ